MTASARFRALRRSIAGQLPAPAPPGMRWVSVVRACYGVVLLGLPAPLITALAGSPPSARVQAVARVLGGRQLAQGTICGLAPARELIEAGAAADGLHSASMLALATGQPGLRRALLADAAIAAALALAAAASLHRNVSRSASQGSR